MKRWAISLLLWSAASVLGGESEGFILRKYLGDQVQGFSKSDSALSIEGVFLERGQKETGLEVIREHRFSAIISVGTDPSFVLKLRPAKTRWEKPPVTFAFWNGSFAFDGTTWKLLRTVRSEDPTSDALNRPTEMTLTYERPAELGEAGYCLLGFHFVHPSRLFVEHFGSPEALVNLLREEDADIIKVYIVDGLAIVERVDGCGSQRVTLDPSKGYALKSIEYLGNRCPHSAPSTAFEDVTSVRDWTLVGAMYVPSKVVRKVSRAGQLVAESEIALEKAEFVSGVALRSEVASVGSDLKVGTALIDERTGGRYSIDSETITVDQLPTQ